MSSTEDVGGNVPASDATAESSAAGEKESVLDAVNASLKSMEGSPSSSETGKETTEAEPEGEAEGEQEEKFQLTSEEMKALSRRTQDRFHTLVAEIKGSAGKIAALSPKAESFDRITSFTQKHGISNSDFNNTLELLRISKSDPNKAFDLVSDILRDLARQTGRALSPELQERIRLGHINEQDARRLSQVEAESRLVKERAEAERQAAEQDREQRAWDGQVSAATSAVDEWAKAKASSDPDWPLKMPHYTRALEAELQRGGRANYPKNKQEAVTLVERVVKQVDKDLKPFRQPKPAIDSRQGEGSSSRNQAEPKDAVEAAFLALAKKSG